MSDYSPLHVILHKPIHVATPRIQRMQIQGYNYRIIYKPGPKHILADTLSRLTNPDKTETIDIETNHNHILFSEIDNIAFDLINF